MSDALIPDFALEQQLQRALALPTEVKLTPPTEVKLVLPIEEQLRRALALALPPRSGTAASTAPTDRG
jgi:hypothetical protein